METSVLSFGTLESFQTILDDITVGNYELHLRRDPGDGRFFIQIQFDDVDHETGEPGYRAYCRKWYLSPHMTTSEVVRTAWKAYEAAVIHEAQETFKYKKAPIYNPHIDVDCLVTASQFRDSREDLGGKHTKIEWYEVPVGNNLDEKNS